MPKERLVRFSEIKEEIKLILKSGDRISTQGIRRQLEETFDTKAAWKTVKSYLDELQENEEITSIETGDRFKIIFWQIKLSK